MVSEKVFCANGCGTEIPAATKGDFWGCCTYDCFETHKAILEFERSVIDNAPKIIKIAELPPIPNPFGSQRGAI